MPSLRPLLALALLGFSTAAAQTNAERARALQGAWQFVETSNPRTLQTIDNQQGYRLFVDGHFAWVRVNGLRPRPQVDSTATSAQLWSVYERLFTAQGGTYEVRGDTLITRTAVSETPAAMAAGNFNVWMYRVVGDELYVSLVGNQAGAVDNVITGLYTRVRFPTTPTN
jgi:hypothetical protein